MDNPTTTTRSHTAKTPRRWVSAVVAATIVVLVAGGALLLVGDGESPELTPIEVVEAYIEARNAYDPVRARELLAEDFRTGEPPDGFTDLTNLELAFEFHEALGVQNSQGECNEQTATAEQVVVACTYMWTTELHRISGDPPTLARFIFTVRDGRISRVAHRASYATFSSWYGNFLSEHPEFREVVDNSTVLDPEGIREFKELLPQYLDLYEEWLNSQESASLAGPPIEIAEAYIEARNAYDAERARELVADDFTTGEHPDGWVDVTGIELAFETHRAYGFHYSDVDCTLGDETSQGISVACDYLWTTELHRIGNHPPTRERLTLIIDDGRIQRVSRTGGSLQFWFQFYDFIVSEQPEFKTVVDLSAQELDPEAVRELGELLPLSLDLYQEWLDSQESARLALVKVVEAYIDARNAYDARVMRSLLSDDFTERPDNWATSFDDLELALEARRIYGFQTRVIECTPVPNPTDQVNVTCTTEVEFDLIRLIGAGEFYMTFRVSEEGRITHYADPFPTHLFMDWDWHDYADWLEAQHPGALDILWDTTQRLVPRLTPEALELAPGILAEYRDWIQGGGVPGIYP